MLDDTKSGSLQEDSQSSEHQRGTPPQESDGQELPDSYFRSAQFIGTVLAAGFGLLGVSSSLDERPSQSSMPKSKY